MIISKTPYRISFFGGGTDFPEWYLEHGGMVVSTTIDYYCHITVKDLPPFYPHRYQLFYSQVERASSPQEIIHPSVRETLKHLKINRGVEIHHIGDLPARAGLGSSSAFTVGLLHALGHFTNSPMSRQELVEKSIHIEQKLIGETVGSQDQTACCHGGMNQIHFHRNGQIELTPLNLSQERENQLQNHLLLFFTGTTRLSSPIEDVMLKEMPKHRQELHEMVQLAQQGSAILRSSCDICEIGKLLEHGWDLKKRFSPKASSLHLDSIYQAGKKAGAIGGKILGAGAGGFMLFFAPPEAHNNIRQALSTLVEVPLRFEKKGTHLLNSNQ